MLCQRKIFVMHSDPYLITISNEDCEKNIWNIYPPEPQKRKSNSKLKKENQINKNVSFLDLNINIQNSGLQTKLYDKYNYVI